MFCKVDFLSSTCAKLSFAYIPRDGISNAPKSGDLLHFFTSLQKRTNLQIHASRIHFAKIHFGKIYVGKIRFVKIHVYVLELITFVTIIAD